MDKNDSETVQVAPEEVLLFVKQYNIRKKRGGIKAAEKKFGISASTISKWLKKEEEKMADQETPQETTQAEAAETPAPASAKGKRYTEEEKKAILKFIDDYNKEHKRGGLKAATIKFGATAVTISQWRKKYGGGTTEKAAAEAPKAAPAKKKAKRARVKKAKAAKAKAKPTAKAGGRLTKTLQQMAEISARMDELKPYLDEYNKLQEQFEKLKKEL